MKRKVICVLACILASQPVLSVMGYDTTESVYSDNNNETLMEQMGGEDNESENEETEVENSIEEETEQTEDENQILDEEHKEESEETKQVDKDEEQDLHNDNDLIEKVSVLQNVIEDANVIFQNRVGSLNDLLLQLFPNLNSSDKLKVTQYYNEYLNNIASDEMMHLFEDIIKIASAMGWSVELDESSSDVINGIVRYTVNKEGKRYISELTQQERALFDAEVARAAEYIGLTATVNSQGVTFRNNSINFMHTIDFEVSVHELYAASFDTLLATIYPKLPNKDREIFVDYYRQYLYAGHHSQMMALFAALRESAAIMGWQTSLDMQNSDMANGKIVYKVDKEGEFYFKNLDSNIQNEFIEQIIKAVQIIGITGTKTENGISFESTLLPFNYEYKFLAQENSDENTGENGNTEGDVDAGKIEDETINGLVNMTEILLQVYFPTLQRNSISSLKTYVEKYTRDNNISGAMVMFTNLRLAAEAMGWTVSFPSGFAQSPTISGAGKLYYNSLTVDEKAAFEKYITTAGEAIGLAVRFTETSVTFINSEYSFRLTIVFETVNEEINEIINMQEIGVLDSAFIVAMYESLIPFYFENIDEKSYDIFIDFVKSYAEQEHGPQKLLNMLVTLGEAIALKGTKINFDLSNINDEESFIYFKDLNEDEKIIFKKNLEIAILKLGFLYKFENDSITISNKEDWNVEVELGKILVSEKPEFTKTSADVSYSEMSDEDKEQYEYLLKKAFDEIGASALIQNSYLTVRINQRSSILTVMLEKQKIQDEVIIKPESNVTIVPELSITLYDDVVKISNNELEFEDIMTIEVTEDVQEDISINETIGILKNDKNRIRLSIDAINSPINLTFMLEEPKVVISDNKNQNSQLILSFNELRENSENKLIIAIEDSIDIETIGEEAKTQDEIILSKTVDLDNGYEYINESVITFLDGLLIKYFPALAQEDRTQIKIYVDRYESDIETSLLMMAYSSMRMAAEAMGFTINMDLTKMAEGEVVIDVADDGEKYYLNLTNEQKEDFQYFIGKAAEYVGLNAEFNDEELILSNQDYEFKLIIEFQAF